MSASSILPLVIWFAGAVVGAQALRLALHWRRGQPADVDLLAGLAALPRRYLVDVHDIVARRKGVARMHALAAGGLLAGSTLAALGIVPVLRSSPLYWGLVAAAFAAALAGAGLVARRRRTRPAGLSGGRWRWLGPLLGLYALGGLVAALATAAGTWPPLTVIGAALAAVGGLGLAALATPGPMRHALAGAVHLAAHPRPGRFRGGRDTALRPLDIDGMRLGAGSATDFAWNRLAAFDACVECGRCELACPAFAAGQPLNPKKLIQDLARAAAGVADETYAGSPHPGVPLRLDRRPPDAEIVGDTDVIRPDTLWSCTTCRACVEACPMTIEHVDAVVDLRRFAVMEKGAVPAKAAGALAELREADDPEGRALAARLDVAAGRPLRVLKPGEATDVLLWLGSGAYDLRHGRVLRALMQLLDRAGVDWAVLGEAERDCGDLARRLGDEANFQRLAHANIAALGAVRFRRILTADPHALHVLRAEYPAFGGRFEVVHHTTLLAGLVAEGRLRPGTLGSAATYHDPCYLGRYNGETSAPRALLDALGLDRREMPRHGLGSFCCGGGGGAPLTDVPGARRIPDIRMDEARSTGAAVVAVACPGCTSMLEGVTGPRPEVRDVAELLLEALGSAGERGGVGATSGVQPAPRALELA